MMALFDKSGRLSNVSGDLAAALATITMSPSARRPPNSPSFKVQPPILEVRVCTLHYSHEESERWTSESAWIVDWVGIVEWDQGSE